MSILPVVVLINAVVSHAVFFLLLAFIPHSSHVQGYLRDAGYSGVLGLDVEALHHDEKCIGKGGVFGISTINRFTQFPVEFVLAVWREPRHNPKK